MENNMSSGEQPGLCTNCKPVSPWNGAEAIAASKVASRVVAGGCGDVSKDPLMRPRSLRAVYVVNENAKGSSGARSPEAGALLCLVRACEAAGAQLTTVNFGESDFRKTAVLDVFFDAVMYWGEKAASHEEPPGTWRVFQLRSPPSHASFCLAITCRAAGHVSDLLIEMRLLENLVQKERDYQALLQQTLQQRIQDLHLLQIQLKTTETQPLLSVLQHNVDEEIIKWLKQQTADSDAINRFVQEDYTLSDVLNNITKDDLQQLLRLRGIWNAILKHRKQNRVLGMEV